MITRDKTNSVIAGVCSGLSKKYDWDLGIIRICWVFIAIIAPFVGIPLYLLVLALMLKNED